MFERFTDEGRRVIVLAQEEARMLNHNYIGTEHFLLGLIHGGVAGTVLASLGVSLEGVRRRVEELVGHGNVAASGHIPFTPRAKRVLELALKESLHLGHTYIGSEHLLLGIIREGEGVAAQVLTQLGVELDAARRAVLEAVGGYSGRHNVLEEVRPITVGMQQTQTISAPYDLSRGPLCTMCSAPLAEKARHQVTDVPATVGAGVVQILIVYCSNCGDTIKVEILPEKD